MSYMAVCHFEKCKFRTSSLDLLHSHRGDCKHKDEPLKIFTPGEIQQIRMYERMYNDGRDENICNYSDYSRYYKNYQDYNNSIQLN